MRQRIREFLRDRIWRLGIDALPWPRRILLRSLRVLLLALQGFAHDQIRLRASALTIYSLMAVVPVAAVAFGIAKGFGIQVALERQLRQAIQGQEEVVNAIIGFAHSLLAETRGGLVAGAGLVVLLWSVIRLLSIIEQTFNRIWGVQQGRSLGRRVTDYLAIVLIAPILLALSGASTATLVAAASRLASNSPPFLGLGVLQASLGVLVPFAMIGVLLAALYRFMPNTRVSWRSAVAAALVAGLLYQIAQWLYFNFQVKMSNYNAVYGTFAALPLFLIWLQLSWLVVLFGAEISYSIDNEEEHALEHGGHSISPRGHRLLALRFAAAAAKRFRAGEPPSSCMEMAHEIGIPLRLARDVFRNLVDAGILSEVRFDGHPSARFQPARPIDQLTLKSVLDALDRSGGSTTLPVQDPELARIQEQLRRFDHLLEASAENLPLADL